jgi:hypothetical protein
MAMLNVGPILVGRAKTGITLRMGETMPRQRHATMRFIGDMLKSAEPWPYQSGRRAMTDAVDEKLDALVVNVRSFISSGVSGKEATARKLEIDDQCQELLTTWLSQRVVDIQHYRDAEAALERLREAVKKECDK